MTNRISDSVMNPVSLYRHHLTHLAAASDYHHAQEFIQIDSRVRHRSGDILCCATATQPKKKPTCYIPMELSHLASLLVECTKSIPGNAFYLCQEGSADAEFCRYLYVWFNVAADGTCRVYYNFILAWKNWMMRQHAIDRYRKGSAMGLRSYWVHNKRSPIGRFHYIIGKVSFIDVWGPWF